MKTKKEIYAIYKDGVVAPDTHLFLFSDPLTAILTLYLFSVSFACKDLKMYSVGVYDDIFYIYDHPHYLCDFYDGVEKLVEIRATDVKYDNNFITVEYINQIISDVDNVIKNKFNPEKLEEKE